MKNPVAVFRALADPNRLCIVKHIAKQDDICARDLLEGLDITQPTLSHHMRTLVACKLVTARKEGRERRYSLNRETVEGFMKELAETLQA